MMLSIVSKAFEFARIRLSLDGDVLHMGPELMHAEAMPVLGSIGPTFLDGTYRVCSRDMFTRMVAVDWGNSRKYIADKSDCDDYAFDFKARMKWAFGITGIGVVIDLGAGHAYNLIWFSDSPPALFEPQHDSWPVRGEGKYQMERGMVIV